MIDAREEVLAPAPHTGRRRTAKGVSRPLPRGNPGG